MCAGGFWCVLYGPVYRELLSDSRNWRDYLYISFVCSSFVCVIGYLCGERKRNGCDLGNVLLRVRSYWLRDVTLERVMSAAVHQCWYVVVDRKA